MSVALPADRTLAPSVATIAAGCDALKDAARDVGVAGGFILDTCGKVSAVMKSLGLEGPSDNSSFGAVAIAIKALVTTASKYVDAKTGVSLREWAEFVTTARTRFDAYLAKLDKVAEIATRYESPQAQIDVDVLRADKRIIEDAQLQTKLWRPVMTRLPQLSHLVDAILSSRHEPAPAETAAEEKGGWSSKLKGVVDTVKERVGDEHAEIVRSLLGPVTDLRHRIKTLHSDVEKMSQCMFEFEDLLELQRAQIQVLLGELDVRQTEMLIQRITVAVVLPQLNKRLAESRRRVGQYQAFLEKLEKVRATTGLSAKVYAALASEYTDSLDAATTVVRQTEADVADWQERGRQALEANQLWLQEERESVTARELVGQIADDHARERLAGIGRELRRIEAARRLTSANG
jgi:hypothetical protein